MSTFNSLGSNYSWRFVWRNLTSRGSKSATELLTAGLGQHYSGRAVLTYKGREALELALNQSGLPVNSQIGINGFTCYVLYQAVVNAGYQPVFIDITPGQTNFGPAELKHTKDKNPGLKAVIIQNTLGYPAQMAAIADFCRAQGILIVEDLAHSLGAVYDNGHEAGTVGSFTMLSFSRDKPLDTVAGGALVDRRPLPPRTDSSLLPMPTIDWGQQTINRLYPLLTGVVRATYPIGLGRLLHFGLRKVGLLTSPMEDTRTGLHSMTPSAPALILRKWQFKQKELSHRRQIAQIYTTNLPADIQLVRKPSGTPAYLRFPLFISDPVSLHKLLKRHQIYISDAWYDAPVAPKRYMTRTIYQAGSCPVAEDLVKHIVNLPTHRHITPEKAADICAKIKQWQALQQKP